MSETQHSYLEHATRLLERIATEEAESIGRAGKLLADRIQEDRLIYVIGPGGHSQIGAEEAFARSGGLACVVAFIDDGFHIGNGSERSLAIERTPGYVRAVLSHPELREGDVLVIVNSYGINAATIDSALIAREMGLASIGITSVENQRALAPGHPSRHPNGQDLCDLVDIVVDTKVPVGDAVVSVDGVAEKVGPVSTILNVFALNSIVIEATAELARRGVKPPLWVSANAPGGDEANEGVTARYRLRIPNL